MEITVSVTSAGVLTDTHQGSLTIVESVATNEQPPNDPAREDVPDSRTMVYSDGIPLPVTFAIIPPSSPTSDPQSE